MRKWELAADMRTNEADNETQLGNANGQASAERHCECAHEVIQRSPSKGRGGALMNAVGHKKNGNEHESLSKAVVAVSLSTRLSSVLAYPTTQSLLYTHSHNINIYDTETCFHTHTHFRTHAYPHLHKPTQTHTHLSTSTRRRTPRLLVV